MSHVPPTTSPIAHAVLSGLAGSKERHLGAIVLRGHLIAVDECGNPANKEVPVEPGSEEMMTVPNDDGSDSWRLYDDSFTSFVQFKRGDLLHHQPGDQTDQCCATGIVWIRYEAPVSHGTTGYAYSVAGSDDGGWHRPGGGWHRPGGGWHRPGGGMSGDSGDWHRPGGG